MHGDAPSSLLPLSDELERLLGDAAARAAPFPAAGLWEDVSGGLHPISEFRDGDHTAALDALVSGHDLTPSGETAGQYTLLDDAGGRFAIDGQTGIVRLADPSVAARDGGAVFEVRVRDGAGYESTFQLRVAAPLPEVVFSEGADPFAGFAMSGSGGGHDSDFADLANLLLAPPPPAPMQAWSEIAAALGALRTLIIPAESAPFGAALGDNVRAFPASAPDFAPLSAEDAPPAPASRQARWMHS